MVALWNRADHYIFILWFLSILFFFSSPNLSGRTLDVYHTSTRCGPSANLECRSKTCCEWLTVNTGPKKIVKNWQNGHHCTTLLDYIFATEAHSDNQKKLVKQQYLLHMSPQYGELRPTNGWDRFVGLGHPIIVQRVLRLGSVTARHFISGRQPNFAAFNEGRHLYSAGRPSHWELAQISSCFNVYFVQLVCVSLMIVITF